MNTFFLNPPYSTATHSISTSVLRGKVFTATQLEQSC